MGESLWWAEWIHAMVASWGHKVVMGTATDPPVSRSCNCICFRHRSSRAWACQQSATRSSAVFGICKGPFGMLGFLVQLFTRCRRGLNLLIWARRAQLHVHLSSAETRSQYYSLNYWQNMLCHHSTIKPDISPTPTIKLVHFTSLCGLYYVMLALYYNIWFWCGVTVYGTDVALQHDPPISRSKEIREAKYILFQPYKTQRKERR